MTGRSKSKLSSGEANELIANVSSSDREAAREAIAKGVQSAQGQWIEAHLIAEALAVELITVAEVSQNGRRIAAYLRELAEAVEDRSGLH